MLVGRMYRQLVAKIPKSKQASLCNIAEVTVMTEFLTGKGIAQVNLDERNRHREEGIAQRNARVGKRPRVEDDAVGPRAGVVQRVDQRPFVIGLHVAEFGTAAGREFGPFGDDPPALQMGIEGLDQDAVDVKDHRCLR